jgi:hypothetical protein
MIKTKATNPIIYLLNAVDRNEGPGIRAESNKTLPNKNTHISALKFRGDPGGSKLISAMIVVKNRIVIHFGLYSIA